MTLPTAILLFFGVYSPITVPAPNATSTPQIEVISTYKIDAPEPSTKEKILQIFQKEDIKVVEIKPIEIPILPVIIAPVMPEPTPATVPEEALVATTIDVENYTKIKPIFGCFLYSDGTTRITQSFHVTVKDQKGNVMEDQEVTYTGSAENNPTGTFISDASHRSFHYIVKDPKVGTVKLAFAVGSVSVNADFDILPMPEPRPAHCDPASPSN